MDKNNFQVVITNQLNPDQDKNLITRNLAALFKIDEQKAAQFLIKPRTVIKDNLDEATAQKYLAAIRQTGAHCEIINKTLAIDLPQIVEPPKTDPAAPTPRTSAGAASPLTGNQPLSLVAHEEKIEKETREELTTLKDASAETLCPDCGTIRGSADALCLHCGYNPNEIETPQASTGKMKWIIVAAIIAGIAIIALLVGLPYFKNMMTQKKIEQDLALAFDVRNQVSAFIEKTNFFPNQNMDADLPEHISNDAIHSIVIGENATITVTMNPVAANNASDQTIIFKPKISQGKIVWNCMEGTLGNEFRPELCRK